jgi:uncharacterized Zn finger protein
MEPIPAEGWDALETILSRQALFAARLLTGEMPQPIEEAFAGAGLRLFPADARELEAECNCDDPARPCPHTAAVFYLMAERFDEDPFQILLFRGRGRNDLLDAIRREWAAAGGAGGDPGHGAGGEASRGTGAPDGGTGGAAGGPEGGTGEGHGGGSGGGPEAGTGSVTDAGSASGSDPGELVLESFWDLRADLEPLNHRISSPTIPEALLRRLGVPPGTSIDSPADAALRRAYQIVSAWALRLAVKEGGQDG